MTWFAADVAAADVAATVAAAVAADVAAAVVVVAMLSDLGAILDDSRLENAWCHPEALKYRIACRATLCTCACR